MYWFRTVSSALLLHHGVTRVLDVHCSFSCSEISLLTNHFVVWSQLLSCYSSIFVDVDNTIKYFTPKISQSQRSVRAGVTVGTCHCEPIHNLICICRSSIIFQGFHLNHYKLLGFITITLERNQFNISYKIQT